MPTTPPPEGQPRKTTARHSTLSEAVRLSSNVRILLADDDPDMRALIAAPLRRRGHMVTELEDGAQLAAYLETTQSESEASPGAPRESLVVISDIRMPGQDGLSVLATMRRAGLVVPVILISALEETEVYDVASELEVAALFQKPFDIEHLCFVVDLLSRTRTG